ncbi:restriction endonuclease subunit S [Nocardiaceae bacterium NPDC056970]
MTNVALGEVVDFYSGGTPSKGKAEFWDGDVPWFSAKDMKRPRLTDSIDHITEAVFSSTSLRKIPAGTVAMVVRGMILAHTVPIAILDVDAAINQDMKALLPRRDIEPSFLAAMLRAQHATILAQVSTAAHGTKKLESRVLEEIRIPLPHLAEQRRIVAILAQADLLRAKRRQILAYLDNLTQSIFHDMFGAESFPAVMAGELMPKMRNGLSPATDGEYPADVLTLSAVTRGTFNPLAVKRGAFAINPPDEKRVTALDFLMCRGNGNKALVGAGAFSPEDRPDLVFPDTVIAGRVDQSKVAMPFLNVAWKQSEVRRQIESVARTTNGTYKVNQQSLSTVTLFLPPLSRQLKFASRVERVSAQSAAVARACAADDEMFDSLQSCAFRGEL